MADTSPPGGPDLTPLAERVALALARLEGRDADQPLLDGGERARVLDCLISVVGGVYSHLPQKRAAYALDPVQALELLQRRAAELSDTEFHRAVGAILTNLRDAHTRYAGPTALAGHVAVLPFLVESYGHHSDPTFVVSKVGRPDLIAHPDFAVGVEIVSWNGMLPTRAVERRADQETGGRPDARRARALETLTFRALDHEPEPDEHWVIVGFRTAGGDLHEVRIPWYLVDPGKARTSLQPSSRSALRIAEDPAAAATRRAKQLLFAPAVWAAERAGARAAPPGWIETDLPDVLAARPVGDGRYGYLRVWSFDVDDDDSFLAEVVRLLGLLPPHGLIVDLRSNPGGLVWAAERMLQLLGDGPIEPARFSLLASPLTRAMAASPFNRLELEAWAVSLDSAVETGELYSQPLALTDREWCNDLGRVYPGRVVAVVDPNTYSSGDLFAAGFVDNGLGPLVCVGEATGGGGANVWTSSQLRDALVGTPFGFAPLPDGVRFTISVRRAIRSGPSDGIPIEDLGVAGITYTMTERDVLSANEDLIDFCLGQLA